MSLLHVNISSSTSVKHIKKLSTPELWKKLFTLLINQSNSKEFITNININLRLYERLVTLKCILCMLREGNSNVYIPNWRYDDKMMLKFMQTASMKKRERRKNSFLTLNCFQCYLHEKFMHFIFHKKSADFYFTITPLTFQRNKKQKYAREKEK